tara:strand:+ start:51 stop:257 length:207 start_codon:yes stop_codon:yes gene_type:complete
MAEYELRPQGVECKPYDPQAEIAALHRLVYDLMLRVSALECRPYTTGPVPPWSPPWVVTCGDSAEAVC